MVWESGCRKEVVCVSLLFECGRFDVWGKLRELRCGRLGMERGKGNMWCFVVRGGREVMFWEGEKWWVEDEGGEILVGRVGESECRKCKEYME